MVVKVRPGHPGRKARNEACVCSSGIGDVKLMIACDMSCMPQTNCQIDQQRPCQTLEARRLLRNPGGWMVKCLKVRGLSALDHLQHSGHDK